MKIQAAKVDKEGREVVLVKVDKDVIDVPGRARDFITVLRELFPNMAIILVARNTKGKLFFFGRPDIVDQMGEVTVRNAEWSEYTVEAKFGQDDAGATAN